jgi:predicted amidohydrolase YtcJ
VGFEAESAYHLLEVNPMNLSLPRARFTALAIGTLCIIALPTRLSRAQQAGQADLVLHNGKILTVDQNFSVAQAVAVRGNEISAVGANADVLKLAGPQTMVIDLRGRTVIPGLIDTHRHIYDVNYDGTMTPEKLKQYPVDWRAVRSTEDVLNQIQGLIDRYKFQPGEWIYVVSEGLSAMGASGSGENRYKILFDELNRWELDKVTPNNPMMMSEGIPEQNGLLVNTKALDIIMASHGDVIKKYGRLWLGANGQPDGHLEPPATRIVRLLPPEPNPADVGPQYRKSIEELGAMGLTTISTQLTSDLVNAYKWLENEGQMTIRMAYGRAMDFGTFGDISVRTKELAKLQGTGTNKMWVNSFAPSAADGSGSRSCMSMQRKTTYGSIDDWFPTGQCHMDSEYSGAAGKGARAQASYFRDWVVEGGVNGIRFANTHTAGERTISLLLGLADQVQRRAGPAATKTWAFDHCTFVNPRDFKEAARLGITFSCAPKYIMSNAPQAASSYGEEIANTYVVPVKSLLDAGVKVVFEADNDDYVWNQLELLQTRKDTKGKVWGPQERIDRTTTLKMATRWAADYVLKPDKLGSIEPGKWADLVVLDKDYMTIPVEEIHTIRPQLTVFDGKMVFLTPAFQQEYDLKPPTGAVVSTFERLRARKQSADFGSGA